VLTWFVIGVREVVLSQTMRFYDVAVEAKTAVHVDCVGARRLMLEERCIIEDDVRLSERGGVRRKMTLGNDTCLICLLFGHSSG
jgi:hypothetical protein